jgi:hypothetical protein
MSKTIWEGTPQGGAVRGTMAGTAVPPIRRVNENKGMTAPKPPAPARPHISDAVRGELSKLEPSLAAGIRSTADNKIKPPRDPR